MIGQLIRLLWLDLRTLCPFWRIRPPVPSRGSRILQPRENVVRRAFARTDIAL